MVQCLWKQYWGVRLKFRFYRARQQRLQQEAQLRRNFEAGGGGHRRNGHVGDSSGSGGTDHAYRWVQGGQQEAACRESEGDSGSEERLN